MKREGTTFSIRDRATRPSTLFAFALTALLLFALWSAASSFDLEQVASAITSADSVALVAALAACFGTLILRGLRWRTLITTIDINISRRAAVEILALSFWVNVILPAKIGDVYRAWLLKKNGSSSFGRAVGTVIVERAVDLTTVALLGALSAYVAFGGNLSPAVTALTLIALALALVGAAVLLLGRGPAARLVARLPLPATAAEPIARAFDALKAGSRKGTLIAVAPYTAIIWGLQAARLGCVALALGLFQVDPAPGFLGISAVVFTALVSAVLSTIPFTPAGIGIVEAGSVGILISIFAMPPEAAIALTLLDRVIDIGSLMVGGGILFAVSPYPRGAGSLR
jgi:uncharacterized membrane protein YbhN (UPF0104 family)